MDWNSFAENDWDVYHDSSRIQKYVEFGKITQEQADTITSSTY